jgi:cytochrome P450
MLAFFTRCQQEYGDMVWLRFVTRKAVLVSHPDAIEQVLVHDNRNFTKNFALRFLRPVLGQGLLLSEGELWRRQRQLMQPSFNRERVEAFGPLIVDEAQKLRDSWREGGTIDLHGEMVKLTLAVAAKALLGVELADDYDTVCRSQLAILEHFRRRCESNVRPPLWVPTENNRRMNRAIHDLRSLIERIIRERSESRASAGSAHNERDDVLSRLLQARAHAEDSGMSDTQLRDETMTMLMAGHETTANTLTFTCWLLAEHPHVEARVLAELEEQLGDRPPTVEDLPRLTFLDKVLKESMRLYPPAFAVGRRAIHDCEIGGYPIPAKTNVLISQWVVHRDERWYERPLEFDPDRWTPEMMERLPKYAYFPFGAGPRRCIGSSLASLEAALALATILPTVSFERLNPGPLKPWPTVTLRPANNVQVRVKPREAALAR